MARGVGAIEALRSLLPESAVEAFALLTHLGDGPVLFALVALLWVRDRRRGAAALGILLGGFALYLTLKAAFTLPRPPPELQYVTEDGYGFPSGHAVGSTVGFGLLALTSTIGTRGKRVSLAAGGVLLVSLSRVVIGVHYLVDVLAGIAVGVVYLVVAIRATRWEPARAFSLAGGLGVAALLFGAGDGPLVLAAVAGTFAVHRLAGRLA